MPLAGTPCPTRAAFTPHGAAAAATVPVVRMQRRVASTQARLRGAGLLLLLADPIVWHHWTLPLDSPFFGPGSTVVSAPFKCRGHLNLKL
jgi:hypothetical protein